MVKINGCTFNPTPPWTPGDDDEIILDLTWEGNEPFAVQMVAFDPDGRKVGASQDSAKPDTWIVSTTHSFDVHNYVELIGETATVPLDIQARDLDGNILAQRTCSLEVENNFTPLNYISLSGCSVTPETVEVYESKEFTGTVTVGNSYVESFTFDVVFEILNEEFARKTVTVPAGSSTEVTASGVWGGYDTPGHQAVSVQLEGGDLTNVGGTSCNDTVEVLGQSSDEPFDPSKVYISGGCNVISDSSELPQGISIEAPAAAVTISNGNTQSVDVGVEWYIDGQTVASRNVTINSLGNPAIYTEADVDPLPEGKATSRIISINNQSVSRDEVFCGATSDVYIDSMNVTGGKNSADVGFDVVNDGITESVVNVKVTADVGKTGSNDYEEVFEYTVPEQKNVSDSMTLEFDSQSEQDVKVCVDKM